MCVTPIELVDASHRIVDRASADTEGLALREQLTASKRTRQITDRSLAESCAFAINRTQETVGPKITPMAMATTITSEKAMPHTASARVELV